VKPAMSAKAASNATHTSTSSDAHTGAPSEEFTPAVDIPLAAIFGAAFASCALGSFVAFSNENRKLVHGLAVGIGMCALGVLFASTTTLHVTGWAATAVVELDLRRVVAILPAAITITAVRFETWRLRKLAGLPERETWLPMPRRADPFDV